MPGTRRRRAHSIRTAFGALVANPCTAPADAHRGLTFVMRREVSRTNRPAASYPLDVSTIDWKRHYRDEIDSGWGRDAVSGALARHAGGDAALADVLRAGGIVSFPHTTLRDSADPLARLAASIVAERFDRVVALGVLHLRCLAEPDRALASELSSGGPRAPEAFARFGGAFAEEGDVAGLAFDPSLVAREFSLDLFRAVLGACAHARDVAPPPVTCIYVGATRDPAGAFTAAKAVARAVRPLLVPGVACVATGDLVHFGNGYSTADFIAALPRDVPSLERHFEARVRAMFDAALTQGDLAAGYDASVRELRSDQRNVLPVLALLLGEGARADVLSFRLTDYGPVLGEPPPCLVATALVALSPAAPAAAGADTPSPPGT